jgi:hypothetical protein
MLSLLLAPGGIENDMFPAVVVDEQLGCGLPETQAEVLAACLRLGVQLVRIAGNTINLKDGIGEWGTARLRVRLANPVSQVKRTGDGIIVTFKRYLEPQLLTGSAGDVVIAIANHTEATAQDFDISILRALERARILDLYLDKEIDLATLEKGKGL